MSLPDSLIGADPPAINSVTTPAHSVTTPFWRRRSVQLRTASASVVVVFSVTLGALARDDTHCGASVDTLSSIIGWAYFSCWSLSFWPQTVLNWSRKSVEGLSFDFVILNLVGFSCYAAFNCAFYWAPEVKAEYAESHDGDHNTVKANDVFFALHAVVLTSVQLVQIKIYERGNQRFSMPCKVALLVLGAAGAAVATAVALQVQGCAWLNRLLVLRFAERHEEESCSVR